jgi:DNA-binding NtrC family response regulator
MLARHLHALSPRAERPFQRIDLGAIDDALAGSELYGHVAGAFTDARSSRQGLFITAAGGTLFLDEIGKTSRAIQQKLLHAVEYGEIRPLGSDRDVPVDVRIIAASNLPVSHLVSKGSFLPDLYARLETFRVELPALRERRADIPALVRYYIGRHAGSCGYSVIPVVHPDLMTALQGAPWPNNLRQLDATVHRLLVEAELAPVLTLDLCTEELSYLRGEEKRRRGSLCQADVERAITETGSIAAAARRLGVHRSTIHRMNHEHTRSAD